MTFWNKDVENKFFTEAMKNFASPEQLFYKLTDGYFAYVPKGKDAEGQTLQSRNTLIGQYTEKWSKDFLQPIAKELGLYAVNSVICPELGLSTQSDADLAFCTTNDTQQKPENIRLIFEIKMSIVNNYIFEDNKVSFVGNYKTHKGSPSILRSDSMLKAIGKSINIRVSGTESTKIPIVIIGNTPITKNYFNKVDFLKQAGIIQGFISLYPQPTDDCIQNTTGKGFQTFNKFEDLSDYIVDVVNSDMNFFSSMLPKRKLGEIITISAKEKDVVSKAEKFLKLIRE
ncbi:MAG: hypothetical protein CSB24_01585 [Deltaproteobacteria bacterium]|nr:MAG: hypothetical protein CSB24_01585 [Deltaproteobacteria bacterium]